MINTFKYIVVLIPPIRNIKTASARADSFINLYQTSRKNLENQYKCNIFLEYCRYIKQKTQPFHPITQNTPKVQKILSTNLSIYVYIHILIMTWRIIFSRFPTVFFLLMTGRHLFSRMVMMSWMCHHARNRAHAKKNNH